jgi:excinuclease ABC subunit C
MSKENLYKNLPETPGVYLMLSGNNEIIYVGKAVNLKRRVSSYFQKAGDYKTEKLVNEVKKIKHQKTDSALEALILESELIKKHQPKFNVLEKDDKSFLYAVITKEKFPRLLIQRGKDIKSNKESYKKSYGPFVSAKSLREALKIIRRIFPWNNHAEGFLVKSTGKACFDYQIGNCPGACLGILKKEEYRKTIRNIELFFEGKKKRIISSLKLEMQKSSKHLDFELAEKIRRQIFSLQHLSDIAFINENANSVNSQAERIRIEGYDISNISGTAAVGSMVVFEDGNPNKSEYRKFKIKTVQGVGDVAMIKEVISRRFRNSWPHPQLILIDGGLGQVNGARMILKKLNLSIPVVGLAKGPERKKNELIGRVPPGISSRTLIMVRDEAHRFAIKFHRKIRAANFISN